MRNAKKIIKIQYTFIPVFCRAFGTLFGFTALFPRVKTRGYSRSIPSGFISDFRFAMHDCERIDEPWNMEPGTWNSGTWNLELWNLEPGTIFPELCYICYNPIR